MLLNYSKTFVEICKCYSVIPKYLLKYVNVNQVFQKKLSKYVNVTQLFQKNCRNM